MGCKSLLSVLAVGAVLAVSPQASAVIIVQDDPNKGDKPLIRIYDSTTPDPLSGPLYPVLWNYTKRCVTPLWRPQ